jgi:hypothetical protein
MFISVVGHSEDPDTRKAAYEISDKCENALAGLSPGFQFSTNRMLLFYGQLKRNARIPVYIRRQLYE